MEEQDKKRENYQDQVNKLQSKLDDEKALLKQEKEINEILRLKLEQLSQKQTELLNQLLARDRKIMVLDNEIQKLNLKA